uniref:Uncharacterized protein n=1 Tax=Kalmanozyma brasiliensis (strain GHG001) TaxID=1365824 RepID=V5EJH0_KALBG
MAHPRLLRDDGCVEVCGYPNALNKENIGSTPLGQPSTSAKTLDIGLSGNGTPSSPKDDGNVSSSDESDDSTLVFFGKPSSAEKKKRVHYEQRVLEKRLKHKDSLDLARRRPISFNPDDTMLLDDPHVSVPRRLRFSNEKPYYGS